MELLENRGGGARALRRLWARTGMARDAIVIALIAVASRALAQDAASPALAPDNVVVSVVLPRNLSAWGMYMNADPVVKAVLVGLVFASIVTWTIWFAKTPALFFAKRRVAATLVLLTKVRDIGEAVKDVRGKSAEIASLVEGALVERQLSAGLRPEGLKERIFWALERIEAAAGERISRGMTTLAVLGVIAPLLGLFGTVWSIMGGFVGISKMPSPTVAAITQEIAAGLLPTALGLCVAIPAIFMYFQLMRSSRRYRALLTDASASIMRLVSRDLDRQKPVGAE
jgi:biopolymer transport protein ExbB